MKRHEVIEGIFFPVFNNDTDFEILNKRIGQLDRDSWQELYTFAKENSLLPHFYKQGSVLSFPPDLKYRLKIQYCLGLKRNIILERETWDLLERFRQNNIPTVPLKGPILTRLLYDDMGLRQSCYDLDFLVRKEVVEDAENLLKDIGYQSFNESKEDFLRFIKLKYARQLHFVKKNGYAGNISIDLHWDLRGFFSDSFLEYFWQCVKETELDGHLILLPTEEALLLYLSLVSLSTFEFVELRYLYDIHSLVSQSRTKLDWQILSERAAEHRLGTYLYFALKLSRHFFNTELPQDLLNRLKPPFIKRKILDMWINEENILFRRKEITSSYTWRYFISNLIATRSFVEVLRAIWKKVFLPASEVMGFYGRPAEKVSYSIYIKRLLKPVCRFRH